MRNKYGRLFEMYSTGPGREACQKSFDSKEFQYILKTKEKFDVILVETFKSDCMLGAAYHLQAPIISLSSCVLMPWHYSNFGNPQIPSYISTVYSASSEKMDFMQRFSNFINVPMMQFLHRYIE